MRTLVPVALLLVRQVSAAQAPSQPTIMLTAYLGVASGHALWNVDRQPVCQLLGGPPIFTCSGQSDTMGLTRDVSSSIAAGLAMVYFPARIVGLEVDVNYLGLPFDTVCRPINVVDSKNQELCSTITTSSLSSSSISFDLGVIARAAPGRFSPYARAGIGILASSASSVEVVGSFTQGGTEYARTVIVDDHPRRGSVALTVGGGVMATLGPGYVFRLEVKDVYASLARVDGPANDLGVAPTSTRAYHHIALTMGLGIVLERKRGRRY
jgi:opacity protein-like surface antigen